MAIQEPKKRMRGSARRARITEAALEVFASRGYHATAMEEIAAAAGVTRSVLYDHFPSKRVLLITVLQEQNARLVEHIGARITGTGSPGRRLRATLDAYFSFSEDRPDARRLLFDHTDENDPEIKAVRWGICETRTRSVAVMLARDLRNLGLDPDSDTAHAVVELLLSGTDGLAQWWARNPSMPRERLVDAAMLVLWNGLSQTPGRTFTA
ncbi:TetR/AcrR family transcriptional regulator [Nonomuraea wenchangensis]|uniref:Transcriptional regulator, TetR family n=1 Tax=Nonomuraea wenchangensis TaxID=568860 RepID=A0A1I0K934_9ACTN|nr:TetR/AcrR family transcriptional regulator [Nonomuraea wenchangensis]SEU20410.1 transcriptional regulator, TetR family [Nonomuraea wenchangensis]